MEWMRSAVFGEDTPSPDRVITRLLRRAARRKRTAMMQEHIARCIQGAKDDDPSVQNLRVYVRSQFASCLRGDLDGVKKKVWERVDPLFFEGRRC
ncbi:unnamed protein product [Ectocarpus sp. CCAP 1310/34]|nr:unnamed protein product [Ectocarpus sp. CCAP 1310/34]